ncbi:MAG: transposase [Terracidiphilus sp.]
MTVNRRRLFQVTEVAELMLDVLKSYRAQDRSLLHAFVIMPDHLHLLLTPAPDVSLEKTLQFIKGGFSFRLTSKRDVWERGLRSSRRAGGTSRRIRFAGDWLQQLESIRFLLRA